MGNIDTGFWPYRGTPNIFQLRAWFIDKTIIGDNGCILWTKRIKPNGYGSARFPVSWVKSYGVQYEQTAHRMAYMIFKELNISRDLDVCHTCDNPPCVNIEHLWLGTVSENVRDCVRKGRHVSGFSGEYRLGK